MSSVQSCYGELKKLKFLFDEIPGSVSCIDENGHYIFVNLEFKREFLKNNTEVIGKSNIELFSKKTSSILDVNNYRIFKLGHTQVFEETQYTKDDKIEYWLSIKKPILNYEGKIEFIIIFSFNITARKKFEAQLGLNFLENDLEKPINTFMYQSDHYMYLDQGSKTLSKTLYFNKKKMSLLEFIKTYDPSDVDQVKCLKNIYDIIIHEFPGNIFWKNNNLELIMISKAQANDLRLNSPKDAIGTTNSDYCDKKSSQALTELDIDIIQNKKTVFLEENPILIINSKRRVKHFLSKKKHVNNPFSEQSELIGTAFDFSLRKKIEINFRKILNKKYLEQEARDTFLANISHDIRTPITGMLGLIDDIKLNSADIPEIQNNVDTLKTITNEFLNLFNGILNTVEENETDLSSSNKTLFNLADDLESCITLFKPILNLQSVVLKYVIEPDTPKVFYANIMVIKRILINLIGNAVKFTSKGEIVINACYKDDNLCLSIRDTGIGISNEELEKIFDRFTKLSPSTKKNHKGYGLGLYMVKRYVQALSGNIDVQSKLGEGTIFKLSFPIDVSNLASTTEQKKVKIPEKTKKTVKEFISNKVLIVEDNKLAAMALKNMIQSFNLEVTLAESGFEAIKFSKKEQFKYIFLDLGLPDQSGYDVLLSLRVNHLSCKTPIFVVSGHVTKEVQQSCIEAGANDTFIKPMTQDLLNKLFDNTNK